MAWAREIYDAATPVIRIFGLGGRRWKRNVAKGARIGPWLQAEYKILNDATWRAKGACLYMVAGSDSAIRYFGISRNGIKHRWRTSPAYDAETMRRLSEDQLFHSQCWRHLQSETGTSGKSEFEVRVIGPQALVPLVQELGPPLSAFAALKDDGESLVAALERWFCNNRSERLAKWNVAMTA